MNKKPISFLILKIVGFLGIALLILSLVFIITGFGDFESNRFMIGSMLMPFGFISSALGIFLGFRPEFTKMRVKNAKYIQDQIKDDLSDLASTNASITSDALTTSAEALKRGFDSTVFCKHCGEKIDQDSKFCKHCGKEQ